MLGMSMVLSTLGVYIRDLKDIIQVFCLVNIYLMPVLYTPGWLPAQARWLMYLNPFTYQTLCYQDAICHGTITDCWVWCVYIVMCLLSLGMGYRMFTKLRTTIGNVL